MGGLTQEVWSDFIYMGVEALASLAAVIAVAAFRKPIAKKIKRWAGRHQTLGESLQDDAVIQVLLSELRVKLSADRATLCLFHNGGTFSSKKPQFRIACVNESLGHGIAGSFLTDQPVLASRMLHTVIPLFDEKYESPCVTRILPSTGDDRQIYDLRIELMESGFSRTAAKNDAIHTSFIVGIFDKYKQVVGFVRVDFCTFHREEGDPKMTQPLPCRNDPNRACLPTVTCPCMRQLLLTAETIENITLKA